MTTESITAKIRILLRFLIGVAWQNILKYDISFTGKVTGCVTGSFIRITPWQPFKIVIKLIKKVAGDTTVTLTWLLFSLQ